MTIALGASLFRVAVGLYLLSAILYLWHLIRTGKLASKVATTTLGTGWVIHTASLIVRTVAAERPPFLNLYEYLLSMTWGCVLVYLLVEFKVKNKSLGSFAVPLITVFALFAARLPSEVNPTLPALKSAWRVPHISTAILAYASFALAFAMGIMYLIREQADKKENSPWSTRLPAAKTLDTLMYRTVAFGFLMQTALIVTGAIWAQYAWGRYWGWDPKETWALITWLIYAAYLHMRVTMGWRGRRSAIVCIVGFAVTMFTLLGVNLLLTGLHSYAG
jgi:cytochrome c-type biogenesis protein CcsB